MAGCSGQPPRLVLAVNPWPGFSYFALAKARHRYDPRRLDLDLRVYEDPAAQREAYISGRAQAIATTSIDVVTLCGVAPERCPVIVFVIDESHGADQLLAREGVRSLADLMDRPIALEHSSLALYLLARAFEREGLPAPDPSQLRYPPAGSWALALRQGQVDAAVSYPPMSENLLQSLPLVRLFSSEELPHEILDVIAVDPDFLRDHPGRVEELLVGWRAVRAEERRRSSTIRSEMAQSLGIQPAALQGLRGRIRYPGLQEQYELLDPRQNNFAPLLERIRKVLYANGVIPANSPLPTTSLRVVWALGPRP